MKLLKKSICFMLATSMVATSMLSVSAADITNVEAKKTALPSSYSSAEKGYLTPVKDQGDTNACVAYATIASCEASMIINNGYDTNLDLSELHTVYTSLTSQKDEMGMFDSSQNYSDFVMHGNHVKDIKFNMANLQGVVTETVNHGQFDTSKMNSNFKIYNNESRYAYNEAYVTDIYEAFTTNPDLVKELIMKYGAGAGEMCALKGDVYGNIISYMNEETGAFYCYDATYTGHAVTFVGWDDNYPKENCTVNGYTPKNNGAWLIKNSFGTDYGNDGYNWISYEDTSISIQPVVFYKLAKNDKHFNTYQYDDLCMSDHYFDMDSLTNSFEGGAYMSNMFTAQKTNEVLNSVSFYTSNDNLDYTIQIYTDVNGNTDPTNGTLKATVSGEDLLTGYHTIELPEPVALNKGEKFSVVVNLKDNQNPTREVMLNSDGFSSREVRKISSYGESFFSKDGKGWQDLKTYNEGNMRIKAFTTSDDKPAEPENYYDSYNGKSRDELLSGFKSSLNEFTMDLESNYKYLMSFSLERFMDKYNYYKSVCENPEKFLAIDFDGMKEDLDFYTENALSKVDVDNVKYYETLPQFKEYTKVYDVALEKLKAGEFGDEEADICDELYSEFMSTAVNNGGGNSYLQNFGDADSSGDINIADATLIQMLISKYDNFDLFKFYNSDVDGDGNINIKDATLVQMYVSKFIEYFPVFDKQFNNEEVNADIDTKTAVENLNNVIKTIDNSSFFHMMLNKLDYLVIKYCYEDALKVLENSQNYKANVIDFKARALNYYFDNYNSIYGQ